MVEQESYRPVYLRTYESGALERKIEEARERLKNCDLCPRKCHVDRLAAERGYCKTGEQALVSSTGPHFGEEPELVGTRGSGTIFFAHCNLQCVYCQNYDISQLGQGQELSPQGLAHRMRRLRMLGCHNVNLVSPTHVVPQILEALKIAIEDGLTIPLVYNTHGYESVETLRLLEGVVDIYMPDTKYSDEEAASKYSDARNYPEVNRKALLEMYNQVGTLRIENGIAVRGLLIRHLVLPDNLSGPFRTLDFIAHRLSKDSYVNIMAQYRPCYMAEEYGELSRKITYSDYSQVTEYARKLGLKRGF
jgi:putative pyruvate formate lyase activating enzyme